MLVTFVSVYNDNLTESGYQQEQMMSKEPVKVHVEQHYIRNITANMIAESLTAEKSEGAQFAPEQEYLRSLYERKP